MRQGQGTYTFNNSGAQVQLLTLYCPVCVSHTINVPAIIPFPNDMNVPSNVVV